MENKRAKVSGDPELDLALDRMTLAANDGFSGGKVTKHDLVTWVVLYFEQHCFQDCLEKIRQDHFDQVAYLESVLKEVKKAKRSGASPEQIATLLAPVAVASGKTTPIRRSKRQQQRELSVG